jgi:hypothetical protein
MASDLAIPDDDGFHGLDPNRLGNNYLKWNAAEHWIDRDGLTPPSPLLIFAIDEALRMWKANKATIIREKPLPNLDELNASVPKSEWERGIDGQLRKPWEHIVSAKTSDTEPREAPRSRRRDSMKALNE